MNDFDYDVLQRKRSTYGARYKKNGSKSRKCTLPQDTMSAAELKRRNGNMNTFNLSKPMGWETFKAMHDDLKCEYIVSLREKFNANGSRIARMMGVCESTMLALIRELGLAEKTHRNMSRAQLAAWDAFCNPQPVVIPDEPCEVEEEKPVEAIPEKKAARCSINSGLLQFTGAAPNIAIALMKFLGDKEYRISVEFEEVAGA